MEADITIPENKNTAKARGTITPEMFWQRVLKPDGCWLYDGAKEANGYGYLSNPLGDKPKFITAHRLAWILTNGPIPEGMRVLHTCDIRSCVNPEHLRLGTDFDNAMDKMMKGRAVGVLSAGQVREIRRRLAAGEKQSRIARALKVDPQQVSKIKLGKAYTWVE